MHRMQCVILAGMHKLAVMEVVHKWSTHSKDWPEIKSANPVQLLKLLNHQQDIVRDHARRRLRNTPDVVRFIDNWLKENDPMSKYSKRYGFFMIKERFAFISRNSTCSSRHEIRAAATHLIRFQAAQLKAPFALLRKMANDPHPRVSTEVIHVVSHLQQDDPAYASILGRLTPAATNPLRLSLQTQVTVSVLVTVLKFLS